MVSCLQRRVALELTAQVLGQHLTSWAYDTVQFFDQLDNALFRLDRLAYCVLQTFSIHASGHLTLTLSCGRLAPEGVRVHWELVDYRG